MRKSRYSEEQIIGILREHEAGASVTGPRGHPAARREAVAHLQGRFAVSERCACRLVAVSRSTVRYQPRRNDDAALIERLRELAHQRPRFGYRRLHALLRREGQVVNHKRVYRVYRTAGLAVPQRKRKRVAVRRGQPVRIGTRPNEHWSLDFMSDWVPACGCSTGRRLRTLSVLDTCTREALEIAVDTSLPSQAVTRLLDGILLSRQRPERITLDNGPELTSRWFDQWADHNGIALDYIEPGKPVQNAGYPPCG